MEEQFLADKKAEFMKEYRGLCEKYGLDFAVQAPQLVEVKFPPKKEIDWDKVVKEAK